MMLFDGHDRDIWYLAEDSMGVASIGNNVLKNHEFSASIADMPITVSTA